MAIPSTLERLGYDSPDGCIATGQHQEVITEAVATRTLTAEESGGLFLFDRAAGVVYTLPAPVIGMQFEFATTVTATSNAHKVITNAATVFMLGMVQVVGGTTESTVSADFNGTTHVAISMNGSTTGGVVGDRFKVVALSATQWYISGIASGSGAVATPAATS